MASFPPPPINTIDFYNLGFKMSEVNGHIESHYSRKTGKWSPLKFVRDPYIRIHGMAPGLNYGVQAYEGLKAFRDPSGNISVFRPDRNAERMQLSAEFAAMPPVPTELFVDGVKAAVALNAEYVPPHETGGAMYIRPQIYGYSAHLGLDPCEEYLFCVYVLPTGVYHGTHPVKCLVLEDFDRSAPNGTGCVKLGGNYAPVLRWMDRAKKDGFGITLHLDSATHTHVDEFSTSGFIGAIVDGDKVTLVVPDAKMVIDSVTSSSIQAIGESFGWKVERRSVKYTELPKFSEVMAAGTAAALVPIRSITRRISSQEPESIAKTWGDHPRVSISDDSEKVTFISEEQEDAGPIHQQLINKYQAIQFGKTKDEFGWCQFISEADLQKATGENVHTNGDKEPSVGQLE